MCTASASASASTDGEFVTKVPGVKTSINQRPPPARDNAQAVGTVYGRSPRVPATRNPEVPPDVHEVILMVELAAMGIYFMSAV